MGTRTATPSSFPARGGMTSPVARAAPVVVGRDVTAAEVNEAFAAAADGEESPLRGILRYSTDPIVSRDVIGDSASCVFDSALTQASGRLVKVFGWYDNEWGYTCRLADLAALVGGQL